MNSEESSLFFNLKDSINLMLQQQVKIIQRCILTCEQLTGKDPKELQLINDLIESAQYINEIQGDCSKIKAELKQVMTKIYTRQANEQNKPPVIKIEDSVNMSVMSIRQEAFNTTIPAPRNSKNDDKKNNKQNYKQVKNVFGCLRYPHDYFTKKILGYSKPFQNLLLIKFVPPHLIESFKKFKLEEFAKFEEYTGLTIPNYFKSNEFFEKTAPKQYRLQRADQKMLYDMYYSKYFSSYTDIATFFTIQSACGISSHIYQYEQYIENQSNFQ